MIFCVIPEDIVTSQPLQCYALLFGVDRNELPQRILCDSVWGHRVSWDRLVDGSDMIADLMHCPHDEKLRESPVHHIHKKLVVGRQFRHMGHVIVVKSISPGKMNERVRTHKLVIYLSAAGKNVCLDPLRSLVYAVERDVTGKYPVTVFYEGCDEVPADIAVCAGYKNLQNQCSFYWLIKTTIRRQP